MVPVTAMELTDGGSDGKKKKKVKPGSFQGLGISQGMYKSVMRMGYKLPTPIQRKTIPAMMEGEDVVAMARTGSGKTAAFLIPMIERLKEHSVAVGVRAVVLSPTRELAIQTAKVFHNLGKWSGLRCTVLVGGQGMEKQFDHLAGNPDVIVATPGRLGHHMLEADLSLAKLEMLVMDEADRLFELGFAEQLQKIMEGCPISRQVCLFSATLPSQLVGFARAGIKNPTFVRLDVETTLSDALELWYLYVRKDEKLAAAVSCLRRLSKGDKSTIMFVATKHHVEFFHELLNEVGLPTAMVYGNMDQVARESQVAKFRKKFANVLVTTDVAARGIDIPMLDHVVNFDFPSSSKLFVHRSGRTARAGRSGLSVSLVTLEDLPYCIELMLFLGAKIAPASDQHSVGVVQGKAPAPCIGAVPALETDVETLDNLIHDEGSTLQSLYKSMMASYHVYNKTRPSASKQSVGRCRELLEECGGPTQLQGLVHPAFRDIAGVSALPMLKSSVGSAKEDKVGRDFIQELRGFRPQTSKKGNVLSADSMRTMSHAKQDANSITNAKLRASDMMDTKANADTDESENESGTRSLKESLAKGGARQRTQRQDRPRLSKRQRQQAREGPKAGDEFDEFHVAIDGNSVSNAANAGEAVGFEKRKPKVEQFYLSVERNHQEDAKERGLEMEQYQMDMVGDEDGALKKEKSVIRWDAKKKKYLPVMISADGRVVKKATKMTNESGQRVKGDQEQSKIYKQWAKTSRKRIQKVGEMEEFSKPIGMREQQRLAKEAAKNTVEFDNAGEAVKPSAEQGGRQRKPVVPFEGKIDKKYLTHKQKRMLSKRDKNDRIMSTGDTKREVKTPEELKRGKKKKQQEMLRQKPALRKEKAKAAKAAYRVKQEERQMKNGARTKSKMLIFEGPKGGTKRKHRNSGFLQNALT